jgi:hypothetical protein
LTVQAAAEYESLWLCLDDFRANATLLEPEQHSRSTTSIKLALWAVMAF